MTNALIIALETSRILIINVTGGSHHRYSNFDSIIPFLTIQDLVRHRIHPNATRTLDLWTREGVDFMLCADWRFELSAHPSVVIPHGVQDVHLAHANPHHGPHIRAAFHHMDLFFLTHFLWDSGPQLASTVYPNTLPFPAAWDHPAPLADLIAAIRGSTPRIVAGVHVRVSTTFLEFIDAYHYPPGWETRCPEPHPEGSAESSSHEPVDQGALTDVDSFCYETSLDSVLVCLLQLLYGCEPADCRRRAPRPA
eukprot:CAMPEP_0113673862 /NCGR_PEP_ID=MMETSP0038_2-20120614/7088_1 /TAXON_ID=2898 /ORGANISM="Cryptomonas paramecium" /LENGTH=251 /DNA_ID=CAMNT_0000590357 /DNA_START=454 /DNA_END=1205 /DNA_ORIENTATION=+ /assembly_acc=CAM_ASM_000170